MGIPIGQMLSRGLDQLGVLYVPGESVPVLARQEREVKDHLAEPVFGAGRAQFLDELQELPARRFDHGTVSPTFGSCQTGRRPSDTPEASAQATPACRSESWAM